MVLVPVSGSELLKSLEFLKRKRAKNVILYVNEVILDHICNAVPLPLISREGRGAEDQTSVADQLYLCNEASITTKGMEFGELPG